MATKSGRRRAGRVTMPGLGDKQPSCRNQRRAPAVTKPPPNDDRGPRLAVRICHHDGPSPAAAFGVAAARSMPAICHHIQRFEGKVRQGRAGFDKGGFYVPGVVPESVTMEQGLRSVLPACQKTRLMQSRGFRGINRSLRCAAFTIYSTIPLTAPGFLAICTHRKPSSHCDRCPRSNKGRSSSQIRSGGAALYFDFPLHPEPLLPMHFSCQQITLSC